MLSNAGYIVDSFHRSCHVSSVLHSCISLCHSGSWAVAEHWDHGWAPTQPGHIRYWLSNTVTIGWFKNIDDSLMCYVFSYIKIQNIQSERVFELVDDSCDGWDVCENSIMLYTIIVNWFHLCFRKDLIEDKKASIHQFNPKPLILSRVAGRPLPACTRLDVISQAQFKQLLAI